MICPSEPLSCACGKFRKVDEATGRCVRCGLIPAGLSCWLCGHAVTDPPQIIGQWRAAQARVAHRSCLRVLGELDLDLPSPPCVG